eukprot:Amastigsp_a843973_9.p2 type:complete len:214 gc:universal Amastigsp_a843973_9:461-1102(+)
MRRVKSDREHVVDLSEEVAVAERHAPVCVRRDRREDLRKHEPPAVAQLAIDAQSLDRDVDGLIERLGEKTSKRMSHDAKHNLGTRVPCPPRDSKRLMPRRTCREWLGLEYAAHQPDLRVRRFHRRVDAPVRAVQYAWAKVVLDKCPCILWNVQERELVTDRETGARRRRRRRRSHARRNTPKTRRNPKFRAQRAALQHFVLALRLSLHDWRSW